MGFSNPCGLSSRPQLEGIFFVKSGDLRCSGRMTFGGTVTPEAEKENITAMFSWSAVLSISWVFEAHGRGQSFLLSGGELNDNSSPIKILVGSSRKSCKLLLVSQLSTDWNHPRIFSSLAFDVASDVFISRWQSGFLRMNNSTHFRPGRLFLNHFFLSGFEDKNSETFESTFSRVTGNPRSFIPIMQLTISCSSVVVSTVDGPGLVDCFHRLLILYRMVDIGIPNALLAPYADILPVLTFWMHVFMVSSEYSLACDRLPDEDLSISGVCICRESNRN